MDNSDEEAVRIAIENDRQSIKRRKKPGNKPQAKKSARVSSELFIRIGARYRRIRKRPKGKP